MAICDFQGLSFNRDVPGLSWVSEAAANQGDFPAIMTAEWFESWALTMFLEQPEANAGFRPVSGEACWFGRIEDAYAFFNFFDNSTF